MKKIIKAAMAGMLAFTIFGCASKEQPAQEETAAEETNTEETQPEEEVQKEMKLFVASKEVPVTWEENEAVEELKKIVEEKGQVIVQMTMYGGFEQVGPLGFSLPANDVDTDTDYGDIVLYTSNMIVIFYGTNSWAYTRLGHIENTQEEMENLLAKGNVTITLKYE